MKSLVKSARGVLPRVQLGLAGALGAVIACAIGPAFAAEGAALAAKGPQVFGIPIDFLLFAATLLGVALLHHRTFTVAATGLAVVVAYKFIFTGFKDGAGIVGLLAHLQHEWVILANLFLLLLGFAVLARHFETSNAPEAVPAILPDGMWGNVAMLGFVLVLSAFLDNIAAVLIGGVIANHVYHGKVHIGMLAAIVAAGNAGGAGSVVGDTTTTMMWIAGVSPLDVLHAFIASIACFFCFAIPASIVQQKFAPLQKNATTGVEVDWVRVSIVGVILVAAITANVSANLLAPALLDILPVLGLAVWIAILATGVIRKPDFHEAVKSIKGTVFLLCLVTIASLMPVETLPPASWQTAFGLGFISSVFDNIPLTALALKQGGYDWGVLAFAVGFGGSMTWFGSSAGVALSNMFPQIRSVFSWVREGWFVIVGYVVGFFALYLILGWHPHAPIDRSPAGGGHGGGHSQLAAPSAG